MEWSPCTYTEIVSVFQEIVQRWLELIGSEFKDNPDRCVGVHCVTGLGRAPVLVAVALIELGMKYEDAIELIRKKRRELA